MFIDSHCHLDRVDLEAFGGEVQGVLNAANEAGVEHMLCISIDMNNYPQVLALAEKYAQVNCTVGMHPNAREGHEPSIAELVEMAAHPRVVGIGETGLDYHYNEGDLTWQHERFERHLEAARQARLPVVIHSRAAPRETIEVLRQAHAEDFGGVLHCFSEDWNMAKAGLDLGFYVSFSGILTFKSAQELREVARKVPADRLLIETDSPYLAPVPHRGKPNHPAWVRHVAECLAEVRGEPLEAIAEHTTTNYHRLFKKGYDPTNGV
ncbi:TatD DNase family protein [Ectothiorhodosinus mongolicus]|uniref:TatD DNase family protein n=1 Tax=Ectothiorhodosinus mongolicus TaxID=233100 RepID=A0A1R3VQE8_9GAMM|nr:TatD family hydrolase [Ectothiorhodosinus mongolicus]ULX56278.1 TatD family deoxyribonuclease [Ectothiorhodosinus mongolicus]SIT65783.1 TatD DNase family protein [Ectothiorhodosinus mongolicus]